MEDLPEFGAANFDSADRPHHRVEGLVGSLVEVFPPMEDAR